MSSAMEEVSLPLIGDSGRNANVTRSPDLTPRTAPMVSEVLTQLQSEEGSMDCGLECGPIQSAFVLQFDRIRLRPVVASVHPHDSLPFPEEALVVSCFPNGQWTGGVIKEEPVNLVFTGNDGDRHYVVGILVGQLVQTVRLHGLAAHTYQQGDCICQAKASGYVAQATSGTHVDVVVHHGCFSTSTRVSVRSNLQADLGVPLVVEKLRDQVSLPVCCGLVLDIPMINSGPEWMRKVFRRIQGSDRSQVPTAEELWAALHASVEVQELQEAGATLVSHMFSRLGISQPSLAALPAPLVFSLCSDVPIRPLFDCFSLDVIFEILGLLLAEHRVVLVAKEKHRKLPWVMEGIRSLAGPFMRISPQIFGYHCPEYLTRVPVPFFVGWNAQEESKTRRRKSSLKPEDEVWQYNVDTGKRERTRGRIPVELPREFKQRVTKLHRELHRNAVSYAPNRTSHFGFSVNFIEQGDMFEKSCASSFTVGCASDMEYGKYIPVNRTPDGVESWSPSMLDLKHAIVALFFTEFARIFRGYDVFLDDLKKMPPEAEGFVQYSKDLRRGWRCTQSCALFLRNFLPTCNWDQYMLQLDQAQEWLCEFQEGKRTLWPKNTCLLVALFHELCCKAHNIDDVRGTECCVL